MARSDDYRSDMPGLKLRDREIDLLLSGRATGRDDLADLEAFVSGLRTVIDPPGHPSHMAAALAATARSTNRRPLPRARRVLALAATVAIFFAFAGVAVAADDAAPGDLLYGLDRALEAIGVGDGGIDERIAEFDVLVGRGHSEEAFEFLQEETGSISTETTAMSTSRSSDTDLPEGRTAPVVTVPGSGGNVGAVEPARPENDPLPGDDSQVSGPSPETPDAAVTDEESNPDEEVDETPADGGEPPGQTKENENRNEPVTAGPKDGDPPGQTGETPAEDNGQDGQSTDPGDGNQNGNGGGNAVGQPDHSGPKDDTGTGQPAHSGPKDR